MAAMSNYLEDALVNAVLRNTSYSSPATVYVALYTSDPSEGNTGTEVSGGSYARKSVTFAAPSDGAAASNATVTFDQATGDWGTVSHFGIFDASTSGNLLFYGALTVAKTVGTGDVFTIPSGSLTVTLA